MKKTTKKNEKHYNILIYSTVAQKIFAARLFRDSIINNNARDLLLLLHGEWGCFLNESIVWCITRYCI
jgi:hypothetical protein